MERRLAILARLLIVALLILTLFFVYRLQLEENTALEGLPSVTTDIEPLMTVILCVSISFWIAFADKKMKGWEKRLLLVGMLLGSLLFFFLGFGFDWTNSRNSINADNLFFASECMLTIAVILLAAIPVFILILRRESIGNWMKSL